MKKIVGIYNLNNTDDNAFLDHLQDAINILQQDNQEVEIQYSTNVLSDQIVLSALVLGRKDL